MIMRPATDKQVKYLTYLSDRVNALIEAWPDCGAERYDIDWEAERDHGMTAFDAFIKIKCLKDLIYGIEFQAASVQYAALQNIITDNTSMETTATNYRTGIVYDIDGNSNVIKVRRKITPVTDRGAFRRVRGEARLYFRSGKIWYFIVDTRRGDDVVTDFIKRRFSLEEVSGLLEKYLSNNNNEENSAYERAYAELLGGLYESIKNENK